LNQVYPIRGWKFRFSGNRSYHLYIKFWWLHELKQVREIVKSALDVVCGMYSQLTYSASDAEGKIYIDIGAIAKHRCVRSLWSLHNKTGRVCIPVSNLKTFKREDAELDKVISIGEVKEIF
jgi:DNA primase catalytic subunit